MFGTDQAAIAAAAERIRSQAGARVHRLGEPDELKEEAMPRGIYDRKKAAATPAEPKPEAEAEAKPAKKPGRKPKAAAAPAVPIRRRIPVASAPRFGVFDDGSVKIALPTCTGSLTPSEAREFIGFLKRIGVPA